MRGQREQHMGGWCWLIKCAVRGQFRRAKTIIVGLLLAKSLTAQSYGHLYSIHAGTSGSAIGAKFGWSMAVSGDALAIGSPHYNAQHGRATVLAIEPLEPPLLLNHVTDVQGNPGANNPVQQRFGASLAMDGNWLVVGNCSPFGTTQYCNAAADWASVFLNNESNWQAYWNIQRPNGAQGGAFGRALTLSGDVLAVGGARSVNGVTGQDRVYIYRQAGGNWQLTDSVMGDGNIGGTDEAFGHALALRDGLLIVGASGDDELGMDCGAAYLFGRDQGGTDNWGLVRKLLPSNGSAADRFGTSVAVADGRCAVGAPDRVVNGSAAGSAYVFVRDEGFPGNWGERACLEPIDSATVGMDFGAAVAIGPDRVAVAAPLHNLSPQGTDGSIHIYRRDANGWSALQRIVPFQDGLTSPVARAGTALAFHGERLLIGAPFAIVQGLTPPALTPTGVVLVYEEGAVTVSEHRSVVTQIWPNPVTDRLYISCANCMSGTARVLDAQGRTVQMLGAMVQGTNTWDLGALEVGAYFIQADLASGERITRSVIRQ